MSDETKCCGNCQWWKMREPSEYGDCLYELPHSVTKDSLGTDYIYSVSGPMHKDRGTDCPCFSPPIPQEVIEAARIHKESSLPCDSEAHIVASWAIEHMPELKGNQ